MDEKGLKRSSRVCVCVSKLPSITSSKSAHYLFRVLHTARLTAVHKVHKFFLSFIELWLGMAYNLIKFACSRTDGSNTEAQKEESNYSILFHRTLRFLWLFKNMSLDARKIDAKNRRLFATYQKCFSLKIWSASTQTILSEEYRLTKYVVRHICV